ncbi:MAG: adenosylcobinamide amidohydrolase [Boseongicola sp.]|nr:adenosylcobinamide amidohydrolase [Boseongicola sp.]
MMSVHVERPWLTVELNADIRALSFAPYRPGNVDCGQILWREVRDADLTREFNAIEWLAEEVKLPSAVAMLTSRNVETFVHHRVAVGSVVAEAVVTVGLSNAERVGLRRQMRAGTGTINIAVATSAELTMPARLEAMSIAASARTAAVMDAMIEIESGVATGTGTDCIVVASPDGSVEFAGMHTEAGEAVGAAVYGAISEGVSAWLAER